MKRPIVVLLLAAVTAVGCGTRGKTGAQGDTGPQGPPGPIAQPPHITSITPEYGSSRTIFTIHGENFGAVAAADTIYVGAETGSKLQVISASSTEIKITGAFEPVFEQTAMPVSIEVLNQVSNPILIQAMPSGSLRDRGDGVRVFGTPLNIAYAGGTLYVVDRFRGVFAHDLASGEITPILRLGEYDIVQPQQVYVKQDGTLMLVAYDSMSRERLFARQTDGGWKSVVDMTTLITDPFYAGFGSEGDLFLAATGRLQHIKADGTADYAWGGTYSSAFAMNDTLYAVRARTAGRSTRSTSAR